MLQGYGSPDGESTCSFLNPRGDAHSKATIEKVSKGTEERESRELSTGVCVHAQALHADTVFLPLEVTLTRELMGKLKRRLNGQEHSTHGKVMDI